MDRRLAPSLAIALAATLAHARDRAALRRRAVAAAGQTRFADAAGLDFQAGGAMLHIEKCAGFPPSAAGSRSAPR